LHGLLYFETIGESTSSKGGTRVVQLVISVLIMACSFAVSGQYKILQMSPPAAKKHFKSQLTRMDEIRKHKFSGYIGEADNGMLAIREIKSLSKDEQKKITKLVDEENKDRKQIYVILAKHNKLNDKEKMMLIRSAYETYKNMDSKKTYHFENKKWLQKF
jgi:uncharacterized protein YdbL (DUF1318 family)